MLYLQYNGKNLQEVMAQYEGLQVNEVANSLQIISGRITLFRAHGKIAFARLNTLGGDIQLFFQENDFINTDEHFSRLGLGDWIEVQGNFGKTSTGEISIYVRKIRILAQAQISWPDKQEGLNDPDARYRNRSLDLWVNPDGRDILFRRSQIIRTLREHLWRIGFTEVETPMLHPIQGGANAKPFITHHNALGEDFFLRIAPELYLKRLVVGGMRNIFEIGKVFRNEGISHKHNPEFTMLEVYAGRESLNEGIGLVQGIINLILGYDIKYHTTTMSQLVSEATGENITLDNTAGNKIQDLYEELVEPNLVQPTFVIEHPISTSPLAAPTKHNPLAADRFELVIDGMEIANGFVELSDPNQQLANFLDQVEQSTNGNEEAMMVDHEYITALNLGLPPTVGFGIGIDRLVMLSTNANSIKEVIAFPTQKRLKD